MVPDITVQENAAEERLTIRILFFFIKTHRITLLNTVYFMIRRGIAQKCLLISLSPKTMFRNFGLQVYILPANTRIIVHIGY